MLEPLRQWFCDVCGDIIATPEDGYVIWRTDEHNRDYAFKVIHQAVCDRESYPASEAVKTFLGNDGLSYLLSFLSLGPIKLALGDSSEPQVKNMDAFVDFFRRMQAPYYEEARKRFCEPDVLELLVRFK